DEAAAAGADRFADRVTAFENDDLQSAARGLRRCRQTGRPAADHGDVHPLWLLRHQPTIRAAARSAGWAPWPQPATTCSSSAAAGAAWDDLPAAQARERWPMLRFDGDVIHHRDAGRIEAEATVRALHRRCAALGVDVTYGEHAEDVRPAAADVVVIAVGAWLP